MLKKLNAHLIKNKMETSCAGLKRLIDLQKLLESDKEGRHKKTLSTILELRGAPTLKIARISGYPADKSFESLDELRKLGVLERAGEWGHDCFNSYYHLSTFAIENQRSLYSLSCSSEKIILSS